MCGIRAQTFRDSNTVRHTWLRFWIISVKLVHILTTVLSVVKAYLYLLPQVPVSHNFVHINSLCSPFMLHVLATWAAEHIYNITVTLLSTSFFFVTEFLVRPCAWYPEFSLLLLGLNYSDIQSINLERNKKSRETTCIYPSANRGSRRSVLEPSICV
jgi:hypothetical protein